MSHPATSAPKSKPEPTARPDRGAFYATVRPTDVFLCTYPKSGTTWLGFLVAQVLKTDPAEQLDLKSFNRYVPDVNLDYSKRGTLNAYESLPSPRLFLCHARYDDRLPNVIYVVRDPRDTIVSYWHYQRFLNKDFNLSLREFIEAGKPWPCDWDQHVAGWLLPRRHPNLLMLRYEDLHADAAGALRKVLSFSGIAHDNSRIAAAVEASRFERMRAAEEQHGVHGKAGASDERFVRKGRIGSWREEMDDSALMALEKKFGPVMQALGYAPATLGAPAESGRLIA